MAQTHRSRRVSTSRSGPSTALLIGAGFVLAIGLAVGVELWRSTGANDAGSPPAAGETVAGGPASVAGLEVVESLADSGRVPLDTPVLQRWRLVNTGTTVVTLGRPTIAVLEGC